MTKDELASVIAPYVSIFAGHQLGDFRIEKRKDEVVVENLEGNWKVTLCSECGSALSISHGSGPQVANLRKGT